MKRECSFVASIGLLAFLISFSAGRSYVRPAKYKAKSPEQVSAETLAIHLRTTPPEERMIYARHCDWCQSVVLVPEGEAVERAMMLTYIDERAAKDKSSSFYLSGQGDGRDLDFDIQSIQNFTKSVIEGRVPTSASASTVRRDAADTKSNEASNDASTGRKPAIRL